MALCLYAAWKRAAAAAAAAERVVREESLRARIESAAADRLSGRPVTDKLCRGLPVVVGDE